MSKVSSTPEIARRLIEWAPNLFVAELIEGMAIVLEGRGNLLRLNLFSISTRILLDHIMEVLAPDEEVERCGWFVPNQNQDKPTREQRLTYALHGGLLPEQVQALSAINANALVRELITSYREINKHAHGREATIVRDLDEQDKVVEDILVALGEFLANYAECRERIVVGIARSLSDRTIEAFTVETLERLDVMASHHSVDWVGIDERRVVSITSSQIEYEVKGSAGVTLLYGSGGDRRRGEGAQMEEQFPISIRFKVPVAAPHDLDRAEIVSEIDTSHWYD